MTALPPLPDFSSSRNQELGAEARLALIRLLYPHPGEMNEVTEDGSETVGVALMKASIE
jgi:hypothetical protein